jgi:hypothetical protein
VTTVIWNPCIIATYRQQETSGISPLVRNAGLGTLSTRREGASIDVIKTH